MTKCHEIKVNSTLEMVHDEATQQHLGMKVNGRALKVLVLLDVNTVMKDTEKH